MVATAINPSTGIREMLFIKIFRIPVNKFVIEWPAGFVDEGESGVEAAVRELKEEAGYIGTPIYASRGHRTDPWKSQDSGMLAFMNIDLTLEENVNPKVDLEPAEDIHTFWLPVEGVLEAVERIADEEGCDIDGRVHAFLIGL